MNLMRQISKKQLKKNAECQIFHSAFGISRRLIVRAKQEWNTFRLTGEIWQSNSVSLLIRSNKQTASRFYGAKPTKSTSLKSSETLMI